MKLFNFLNKFYKKEEKEIKEIKLEEIREIIEDYFKNKKRDIKIKIEKRKEKTEIKKKEARNNLKELKEVELRNKNVPERVKQIIDGNRETYIQKVNRLIDEISFPEKIEETYEFCNSFEQIINHFGKSTIKPYQILQEFFRDISSKIAGNIRDIDKQIKEIKTILKNANMKKRKKIMMEIDNLEEIRMIEKELEKEKEKIKEKEKEKEKEIKNKEKRIEILNNCEERKKFEEKKEEKEEKEKGKKRIEMGLWHSFSVIEASLKKYERITLEKEVVNEYLKDPLKKILEDAELKILEIIDKMKK
jgi:hypothetical protein